MAQTAWTCRIIWILEGWVILYDNRCRSDDSYSVNLFCYIRWSQHNLNRGLQMPTKTKIIIIIISSCIGLSIGLATSFVSSLLLQIGLVLIIIVILGAIIIKRYKTINVRWVRCSLVNIIYTEIIVMDTITHESPLIIRLILIGVVVACYGVFFYSIVIPIIKTLWSRIKH